MKRVVAGGTIGVLSYRALDKVARQLGENPALQRINFKGRSVTLTGGVVTAAALTLAHGAASLVVRNPVMKKALRGNAFSAATSGFYGYIDDMDQGRHDGDSTAKGFHGHLSALKQGRITTGMIKIVGISSSAVISAAISARKQPGHYMTNVVKTLTSSAIIAGSANLANLFDLRPGRLQKVVLATCSAIMLAAQGEKAQVDANNAELEAGLTFGVAAAGIGSDLREETMNGDTGANAIGACVGGALAKLPLSQQLIALTVIVALMLASEKVSFTKVINETPFLKALDDLGRRKD